MVTYFTAR